MSSCLSGGGRAYRIQPLDLELIKSPSSWISNHSSSPSSTLSESSNCPLAISTRKPRTPRKRPNQTYNEAAAILSTAYPKIFPTKPSQKFTKSHHLNNNHLLFEPSDLLMPFHNSTFLLDPPRPNNFTAKAFNLNPCHSPGEEINSSEICNDFEQEVDFDAESMLDEEMGEGIESIMGNLGTEIESIEDPNPNCNNSSPQINTTTFCYGYPVGLGFEFGYGMRREMKAIRNGDECDWWRFPSVNLVDITPKIARISAEKKKNNNNKVEIKNEELGGSIPTAEECAPQPIAGLLLKLNYDGVLNEWSDKVFPFSSDSPAAPSAGNDVQGRLAQIDLFSENGGIREASVLRYKEKRRTRLFSKKIRYQVRKLNADRRPRMKVTFYYPQLNTQVVSS
ncbi:hypothetical protein ACS0TY_026994 [Phlomoides rotata]